MTDHIEEEDFELQTNLNEIEFVFSEQQLENFRALAQTLQQPGGVNSQSLALFYTYLVEARIELNIRLDDSIFAISLRSSFEEIFNDSVVALSRFDGFNFRAQDELADAEMCWIYFFHTSKKARNMEQQYFYVHQMC